MFQLNQVIDRIANYAEQDNLSSCLYSWCGEWSILTQSKPRVSIEELNSAEIAEILTFYSRNVEPKLSFEKITETTQEYPFNLPLEIYELYSRGNGCLPIGLETNSPQEDNSYAHYFHFPGGELAFQPLHKCMYFYKSLAALEKKYQIGFDLHWFPVAYFEDLVVAVIGNETQQETSPIISFYDNDFNSKIEWSSVTNMLSAWIEVREKNLKHWVKAESSEIKSICRKYGVGSTNYNLFVP